MSKYQPLQVELMHVVERKVVQEAKEYSKSESCLKYNTPDQVAAFSNKILCEEIRVFCPIYSRVVRAVCGLGETSKNYDDERAVNAVALATSALIRCRNPNMYALAYRLSLILFHSGISYEDCRRLNHLGVCMSHPMVIDFQIKMSKTFDHKVMNWKREIEETKSTAMFLQEITEKQVPLRAEDDMHTEIVLGLDENTLKDYRYYSDQQGCNRSYVQDSTEIR